MELATIIVACSLIVAPEIVQAIVATESNGARLALNNNNERGETSYNFGSEKEAVETAKQLIARGHSVDLGLGQINSGNLPALGLTVDDIFDSCTNLRALETIFLNGYLRAANAAPEERLGVALSFYNTGHPVRGIENGYVSRVFSRLAQFTARPITPDVPGAPARSTANRALSASLNGNRTNDTKTQTEN